MNVTPDVRGSETGPCCQRTYGAASVNERFYGRLFHGFLFVVFLPIAAFRDSKITVVMHCIYNMGGR